MTYSRGAWLRLLLLIAALCSAQSSAAQTSKGGMMWEPVPAAPGAGPAPGCMIGFSSPRWPPGDGPDFPCAVECTGPSASELTIEMARDSCIKNGPGRTIVGLVYHPNYKVMLGPISPPPGSSRCTLLSGEPGAPNGAQWFPRGHPRCAGVSGDPHLTTFDGYRFDLQAAGEFVAARSLVDEFEVQMRLEPWNESGVLSIATAAAARVGSHRVTIVARGDTPLRVDGEPHEVPDGHYRLIGDEGAAIFRTGIRYSIVWPDGTNLHVDRVSRHMNLYLLAAEPRDGRLVGVLGDGDGDDGTNDFRTRDGRALTPPLDFETLYKVFAESWRVSAEESLFDYGTGESTETFSRREVPTRGLTTLDLAAADRSSAEQRCRAAGVTYADALDDCVYDVGYTGDEEFSASALTRVPPRDMQRAAALAEPTRTEGIVRLAAPSEGIAAHNVSVRISGPAEARHWLGFAPAGSPSGAQAANPYSHVLLRGGDEAVTLLVPTSPGDYELRYRDSRGPYHVALRQPFRSVAPNVSIDAPPTATPASSIRVQVSGDVGARMTLVVVPAGSPDTATGFNQGLQQGTESAVTIRLRDIPPGSYEIRCVSSGGTGTQVYARHALTIQ